MAKIALAASFGDFQDRLKGTPKKQKNAPFTGADLKALGKDFWGIGKDLNAEFIEPAWRFPIAGGGYHPARQIYERLVKLGRIIPPPDSPLAK